MRSYYAVEEKRQGVRRGKCSLWLWASQLSFLGVISPRVKVGFGSGDGRALLEVSALMFSGSLATSSSPARGRTGPSHNNSLTSSSYSSPGGCPLHPYTNTLLSSPCSLSSQLPCFLLAPWSLNFISLAVVEKGRDPALHLGCKPHKVQGMTLAWTITSFFP